MNITCIYEGKHVNCMQNLVAGTVVKFECDPEYTPEREMNYREIVCQDNGEWSAPLYRCTVGKTTEEKL